MNVADACNATVHEYEGGADSLGPRIGKRGTSLSAEVQVRSAAEVAAMLEAGRTVPKFGLLDAMKVMRLTGDLRVLNAMAVELGCMVVKLPALDDDEGPAAAEVAEVARGFSDLMSGVVVSLADQRVTDRELREVDRQAGLLIATTQRLLASLARMNAVLHKSAPGAAP
ncbi:phage regulatory CII family protein [Roseateles sp. DC23W]|uniref:Phage regulatory CII family protein n=1 Tax=Pelomonas dachongensis TaxID=3299029 RepID=A0ABW7EK07_9BURK